MIVKYMTVDGKFYDSDADLVKVVTGDGAGYYLSQEKFDEVKTKGLNSTEVTE